MNTDDKPIRQIGIELDQKLHAKFGDVGDTFVLLALAYLEGLDTQKGKTRD